MHKVLVAMPSHNTTYPQVIKGLWGLDRGGNEVLFQYYRGYSAEMARNGLTKEFLDNTDCTHVLFLDADNVLRSDTLTYLLGADTDIAAAWYTLRFGTPSAMRLVKEEGQPHGEYKSISVEEIISAQDPIQVDGTGFGAVLIKREVLAAMRNVYKNKWFEYIIYDNDTSLSEDNEFIRRAKSLGFNAVVHPKAKVGHIIQQEL